MNRENLHQSLAAANVICSTFVVSTHIGWVSPAIDKLKSGVDGLKANHEEISWIASISEISRFFGPLIPGIFIDRMGRMPIILLSSFSMFLSWLIMVFAGSIKVIYWVKLLVGITQGAIDATSGTYLAENCTPKMRGVLNSIIPLCSCVAYILEYILVSYKSFTFVAIVNAIIGFISLSTCIFLKETPYYLVMKGRIEEAKRNLLWLRGKIMVDGDIKFEMDQIQQNMQQEMQKRRSLVSLFGNPENYKSLILASTLSFLIPTLGSFNIIIYGTMIFQTYSAFSAKYFAIIYTVFQLISNCISPFLIERYNRRTFLRNLLVIMVVSHGLTVFLFWMRWYIADEYFPWLIFATVTTFGFIFSWAFPLMMVIRSELLPTSVRAIGGSLNIMTSSIGASLCIRLFIPITDAMGIQYNFLFSFIFCILQFILVQTMLPDTKGKTLVEIQMLFHARK